MGRIALLSSELVNKIAAGEVVERPASVVKELAENAVDAQAASVRLWLQGGGLAEIVVADDGCGMSSEDARLSLERHATSKLRDAEGLFRISTKGFRGEALPSIASVSCFSLSTSEAHASEGTKISVQGGGPVLIEPCAPLSGTRIVVQDLFFNTPARKKFLKRQATELAHCEEAVIRLALAHPEVGFFVEHEGRQTLAAPATSPAERVAAVLGPEAAPHLLELSERRLDVEVVGFVAAPEFTLSTARGLYTLVNRRYIRDRGLTAAIQRAFQDALPPGRQPVAVVCVSVDPGAVDINVHPQKLEVRFSDPRSVYEAVGAAVSRALKAAPWRTGTATESSAGPHYELAVDRFLARAHAAPLAMEGPPPEMGASGFGTSRPSLNEAPPPGYFGSLRLLGVLARRLWVCEAPGGSLVVIDPRAVAERVLLTSFAERLSSTSPPEAVGRQTSLFSARVELSQELIATLERAELGRLGLEWERFGGSTVLVRSMPGELAGVDPGVLLTEVAARAREGSDDAALLRGLAAVGAQGLNPDAESTEVARWLTQLDRADWSAPVDHPKVVVHQAPLLVLAP